MKKYILILSCVFCFVCCENRSLKVFSSIENISKKEIGISSLELEVIKLPKILSSYTGKSHIVNDSILFVDERFGYVYIFDKDLKFCNRHLGQGRGPKEINTSFIDAYSFIPPHNNHLFIGSAMDCHLYNSSWSKINFYTLNWRRENSIEDIKVSPKPDMRGAYTLQWEKLNVKCNNKYAFIPIYMDSNEKTLLAFKDDYYQNSRIIARIDLRNGYVTKIMGALSPIYQQYKYIPQLSLTSMDLTKNNELYIGYEPDSLIYITDVDFNVKKSFGYAGQDMYQDYTEIKHISNYKNAYYNDLANTGYYSWLEYIDERDLLFRSYKKGGNSQVDGLQIYKKELLIADIKVPRGFKVLGYIEPYFYSQIFIDEDNEEMHIYRFKTKI